MLILGAVGPLFAGVLALGFAVDDPGEAVSILYTVPIALVAVELGTIAGLAAAGVALALFALSTAGDNTGVSVVGFFTRGIAFFLLGGLLGYMSERLRMAHDAVTGRERQLRSILDNSSAVIYIKDPEGRFVLINRKFEELFHVTRQDVVGKTDRDLFPGYMADAFRANDRRVLKEGRALEMEEVAPQDDGQHTYISVKFPLQDDNGMTYVCGISTDISGRKRAEQELKESKDRVRDILETALDAFVSMDAEGNVTAWNHAAEETFGWPASKIIGRSLVDTIIPPLQREAYQEGLREFLATGKGPIFNKRIELTALHRDGREFPIEMTITPVKMRGGFTFHAFMHDISERKRLEAENLRLANAGERV
jgi:PAS domain S-box-containing protein